MERQIANDFPVDTNGHCFICLNKVLPQYDLHKLGLPSSHVSVHSLSQYLKMDMSKVFDEKDSIPSELLDDVKRSKLKVSLCEQCSKWNERLSKLFRQLEKIEAEVIFYLRLIYGNLRCSDENGNGNNTNFNPLGDEADSKIRSSEKLRIVTTLRKEAKHRCSLKLKNDKPRVNVRNLTTNQIVSKQQRISLKSQNKQHHFFVKSKSDDDNLSRCPSNFCDDEQYTNERHDDGDGTEYFVDDSTSVEGGISENEEESNNPQVSENGNRNLAGGNLSNLPIKTEPGAAGTNLKRKLNIGIVPNSPTKIFPSLNAAVTNIEKLTFVVNPETSKFRCNICSAEYASKARLKRHYESVHLKIRQKCNLCGKEFGDESNYNAHFKRVHVGVRFKCNLCGRCFTQKRTLIKHQQSVHTRNNRT